MSFSFWNFHVSCSALTTKKSLFWVNFLHFIITIEGFSRIQAHIVPCDMLNTAKNSLPPWRKCHETSVQIVLINCCYYLSTSGRGARRRRRHRWRRRRRSERHNWKAVEWTADDLYFIIGYVAYVACDNRLFCWYRSHIGHIYTLETFFNIYER